MGNFKKLRVWQEGMQLAKSIYGVTKQGEFARDYGLKDQIQRASVSIPSNIAEGDERKSNKEAIRFFYISKGSTAEVITQLNLAYMIGYIDKKTLDVLEDKADKISATLRKLIDARADE